MSAPIAPWTEHRTPEGRPYWYHTLERRSVWEKPSDLKTPRERALEATPWKEYKSGDRSYYVHSVTKQSTWTLPVDLKQILDQYPLDGAASAAASPRGGSAQSPPLARSPQASQSPFPSGHVSPNAATTSSPNPMLHRAVASNPTASPLNPSSRVPAASHTSMSGTPELKFQGDREAAESAFTQLLRETGVDVDWTWETTMRTIITNPLYKALKTIAERKAAFHKYVDDLRRQRALDSQKRIDELKPAFQQLVLEESRLKSYSSFPTAKKFLGATSVWKQARDDDEARAVYETVMQDLRQSEKVEEARIRQRNRDMLLALLKTFEADVFTRWRDAHRTVVESQEYTEDDHLSSMELGDMLQVFEEMMRSIEKETDAAKRREMEGRRRKERQNRDAFKAFLRTMALEGKIKPRSSWGEIFPLIEERPEFLRVVGQPGSTPLDLFFDLVDELDQELERQTADALQHISASGHSVTPTTTEQDFLTWTSGVSVPTATLTQIYHELVSYLAEQEEQKHLDERRKLERKHRHSIEDLRYAFKKLDPPLNLDAPWHEIKGQVENLSEYKVAEKEDERVPRWAWDKFVRRQKEKERELDDSRKRKDRELLATDQLAAKRLKRDDEESEPEEGQV